MNLILLGFIWSASCGGNASENTAEPVLPTNLLADSVDVLVESFTFPYKVNDPSKTFKLSSEIQEISGLSSGSDPKTLLSVNDEKGIAFVLNTEDGSIIKKFRFDKNKDYEGIELVGDKIYVVESNGTLYRITKAGTKDQTTEKIHTPMSFRNDIEGLGYDDRSNELILACKANGSVGENVVKGKAFYRYSLNDQKLIEKPFLRVSKNDINTFYTSRGLEPSKHHLKFEPSAIALDPLTHNIYALASAGKKLIVFDSESFKILDIISLKPKIYKQPEGICFSADGTMYIASEGQGGKGRLFELKRF